MVSSHPNPPLCYPQMVRLLPNSLLQTVDDRVQLWAKRLVWLSWWRIGWGEKCQILRRDNKTLYDSKCQHCILCELGMGTGELPQQGCNQHYQRNIQREPSTRLRSMYRICLVCIWSYRGNNNKQRGYNARNEGHDAHLDRFQDGRS